MAPGISSVYIGADIGGTKTLVVACDVSARELRRQRFATPLSLSEGLDRLVTAIATVAGNARIAAIGVSIGGPIDRSRGTVSPPHQPEWREVPLRSLLEERFGCPCRIEVDTDAAALGEWYLGHVRESPLVYLTLSTGIGGALVLDGQLYRGAGGTHPEPGHQTVPNEFGDREPIRCACGAFNCLEALISGRALQQRFGQSPEHLPAGVWEQVGRILGHGLRNIALLYAPRRIVLGGGLAIGAAERLVPVAQAMLQEAVRLVPVPRLAVSVFGAEASLWGAVGLALGYGCDPAPMETERS